MNLNVTRKFRKSLYANKLQLAKQNHYDIKTNQVNRIQQGFPSFPVS